MIKYLLIPLLIPHIFCYTLIRKDYAVEDFTPYFNAYGFSLKDSSAIKKLVKILLFCPEYRNVFYARVYKVSSRYRLSMIMEFFLPSYKLLSIGTFGDNIGKCLYIEHGNSTIIHAKKIGDNCWVNQNVTIGDNGRGIPTIGNNVRIGTGAVVLGPIRIGNNVVIGANATVVKDIPDDCTVVPSPSYIIKRNGEKVYQKL